MLPRLGVFGWRQEGVRHLRASIKTGRMAANHPSRPMASIQSSMASFFRMMPHHRGFAAQFSQKPWLRMSARTARIKRRAE
jgi:hypothetical protein